MALLMDTRLLLRKVKDLRSLTPRRHRVKEKWAATRAKCPASSLALQHFDTSYSAHLGELWPSVRVALLSERKYGALLNNFSHEDVLADLQAKGCRDFINDTDTEAQPYSEEKSETCVEEESNNVPVEKSDVEDQLLSPLKLSPNIKCVVFPRGDLTRFKPARPDIERLLGYYLMDAASVLPCLALDVQEGHNVLDLCAAPGGKTLALLQTQAIRFLCVNDSSAPRTLRLRKILHSYIPKHFFTEKNLRITSFDGTKWGEIERNTFDRVLVDVPCTTDRHSLMEDDNNIFNKIRTGERRRLPQLQLELLLAGIQAACPGGEIMYSTCTLSQIQNLSVVEQAVHLARENHGISVEVVDLRPLTRMFRKTFHFAPDLHLGEMVIPHLAANFGPIYMCKLRRLT
ncbi:5-methylcytosine rRNA methyltransferase NSUN4 isoform X1 [Hippoglossus hippoglossus]|uniref:5-methylcytosine rRNA methyltransferase NSUN4 isoform X1 n=1 Tax=Hippoglossus hippoglossus TaxID=8267 RepID=UPI00148D8D28|nr:5-methylcytosine rRNA methyltransferase NSUN4 isoform X1 [Hippoglossus hippoglossus]XP_034470332.1 5-methylcytosine rRNA methyltransferase NSUN4 isoform X1 [Hippoglossus hippoglossus]